MNNNFLRHTTQVAPYYRVLFQENEDMVNNWNQGRYVSYHFDRHPSWDGTWNQNQSPSPLDYPLEFAAALYNWRAQMNETLKYRPLPWPRLYWPPSAAKP
jgi:hypothetical protein